jgi:membrane fusion protein (multidrug efflux system)
MRAARGILLSAETSRRHHQPCMPPPAPMSRPASLLLPSTTNWSRHPPAPRGRLELARAALRTRREPDPQTSPSRRPSSTSRAPICAAARAELAEIDAILRRTSASVAPFAGRLGILQVRLGDYVEAGTPLVTLQDLSQLEVDFSVPDRYAPLLRPGLDPVAAHTAAFPERSFPATLQAVDARSMRNTRNLLLRATIEDGEGLLPGMFARLTHRSRPRAAARAGAGNRRDLLPAGRYGVRHRARRRACLSSRGS